MLQGRINTPGVSKEARDRVRKRLAEVTRYLNQLDTEKRKKKELEKRKRQQRKPK